MLLLLSSAAYGAAEPFGFLGGPQQVLESFKLVLGFATVALAPALLIMMTSFTRLIIIFSFMRHALGVSELLPHQLLMGLSLLLTFFIMSPVFEKIYNTSLVPYMDQKISQKEALETGYKPLKAFMMSQTRSSDLHLFEKLSKNKEKKESKVSTLLPAFVLSELKTAFQIGFIIYIPFLIIDMLVAGVLMSMGMMALSPLSISLPLKIILFVFVDGWSLLADSLVRSFQ